MYGKKTDESKSKMNLARKVGTKYRQIELVSFGDRIPNGNFTIHSRFRRTINFCNNSMLISVVSQDIGEGPFNIIVHGFDLKQINSLSVLNNIITINNTSLIMFEALKYTSKFSLQSINKVVLTDNLSLLERILVMLGSEKSLCFLLDEKREQYFKSCFEKEFVKRMKSSASLILKGEIEDLIEGVSRIKGCGFGLTPSGDDFLVGLLSGLYVKQEIEGNDLSEVRKMIYTNAQGENLISNSYFTTAYQGLFSERFKNFILSLLFENNDTLIFHIKSLLNIGATSGADTLVGFIFAWKKAGELWS